MDYNGHYQILVVRTTKCLKVILYSYIGYFLKNNTIKRSTLMLRESELPQIFSKLITSSTVANHEHERQVLSLSDYYDFEKIPRTTSRKFLLSCVLNFNVGIF